MKQTRLNQMECEVLKNMDAELGAQFVPRMEQAYAALCETDPEKSPDLIRHLHNNIYPVIAAFRALIAVGIPREEASQLAQNSFLALMEAPAASIRKLCRIPGFYRMVPWLFGKLMPKLFKKEAGFAFSFYPAEPGRVRFDMEACPYFQTCQDLGCPEIAPVFCATDDICYGNMHPRLFWNRTQTIARGGKLCDFDLQVKTPHP